MTGKAGTEEIAKSIQTLFSAAAWADKYDGQVHGVPIRGVALAMNEPVGKIAALCDDSPLLGLIQAMAPAIAMGNRITLLASHPFPLVATDFYQVLDTSDVPAGVVNILTGSPSELAPHIAKHMDIDAVWSFSPLNLAQTIEAGSALNLKRTWITQSPTMKNTLRAATEVKNVWVPYGE